MPTLSEILSQIREANKKGNTEKVKLLKQKILQHKANYWDQNDNEITDFIAQATTKEEVELVKAYFVQNVYNQIPEIDWVVLGNLLKFVVAQKKPPIDTALFAELFKGGSESAQLIATNTAYSPMLTNNNFAGLKTLFSLPNLFAEKVVNEIYYSAPTDLKTLMQSVTKINPKTIQTDNAIQEVEQNGLTQEKLVQYKKEGVDIDQLFEGCCLAGKVKDVELFFKQGWKLDFHRVLAICLQASKIDILNLSIINKVPLNEPFTDKDSTPEMIGLTPLLISLRNGDDALFDALINSGGDVGIDYQVPKASQRDVFLNEQTALSYAFLKKNEKAAMALITRNADVILPNNKPILYACQNEQFTLAQVLFQKGARLSPADALDIAFKNNRESDIPKLLELSSDPTFNSDENIKSAVEKNDIRIINHLLQIGVKPERIFKYAEDLKQWDIVKLLFSKGFNPSANGTPIKDDSVKAYYAHFFISDSEALKWFGTMPHLLSQNVIDEFYFNSNLPELNLTARISDKAKRTSNVIETLVSRGLSEFELKRALKQGVYTDPLFEMTFNLDKKREILTLLKMGVKVPENIKLSPLLIAMTKGESVDIKDYINFMAGDDLNINYVAPLDRQPQSDVNGETALSYAIGKGFFDIAKRFLSRADIDVTLPENKPLFLAASAGNLELISLLLKKGANVDRALFQAVKSANDNAIRILTSFGAKLTPDEIKTLLLEAIKNKDVASFVLLILKMDANQYLNDIHMIDTIASTLNVELRELLNEIQLRDDKEKIMGLALALKNDSPLFQALTRKWYETEIKQVATMTFTRESKDTKKEPYVVPLDLPSKVIYNIDGYLDTDLLPNKGNPLFVGDRTTSPIGYNIHLPPQGVKIKNILVQAYGGFGKADKDNKLFLPYGISAFEQYLLKEGTIIITLNLPDFLKLEQYQAHMSEDLHNEIHAAIDKFYKTLKNAPAALHPDLAALNLNELKMYLFGASFGGKTAIRHAQMFPGTFTGYIGHNGAYSNEVFQRTDKLKRENYNVWMDPGQSIEMQKIVDPILLMANRDDNNVDPKVSFEFYHQLIAFNKAHLARLCITQKGNVIPKNQGTHNKGHFYPETKQDLTRYAETVLQFIEHGPSSLPGITTWQAFRHDTLANRHSIGASLQKRFIAELLEEARFSPEGSKRLKAFAQLPTTHTEKSDDVWYKHLKPLYYAMHFADKLENKPGEILLELERLEGLGLPTNEMIKKVLLQQLHSFGGYMKELYDIEISPKNITDDDMVAAFREKLKTLPTEDSAFAKYMLGLLYQSNPELLTPLYSQFEKDTQLESDLQQAKLALKTNLLQQRKYVAHAWKQSAQEALKREFIAMTEAMKKDLTTDYQVSFGSLLNLSRRAFKFKENRQAIETCFAEMIMFLEKQPKADITVNNLVWVKLTHAVLTENKSKIEKAKQETCELLVKLRYPQQATSNQRLECIQLIDGYMKVLNNQPFTQSSSFDKKAP